MNERGHKMIQVDDAGWGSLVGGVLIGACRAESPQTQHAFREVPVTLFQGEAFKRKLYLEAAANAPLALMAELRVSMEEEVQVCTGYVLKAVRSSLAEVGYQVTPAKIGEPLQTLIEQEFLNHVLTIGVDTDLETMTEKRGLYFWQCINWLKGGDMNAPALPEREPHCKTGWSLYPTWAIHPYDKAKRIAKALKMDRRARKSR